MEIFESQKPIQRTYYVKNRDMIRLDELIRLMPNMETKSSKQIEIVDYFYETPENLMETLDASIRVRIVDNSKQTLSIVCKNDGVRKEFETDMHYGDKIQDKNEYILFLEDKLQDMYTHRMDADIARMLKGLKVFLYIETHRLQLEIFNNTGFNGLVNFDAVMFNTKRHQIPEYVFEIKMNCMNDIANKTAFERFCYALEQKVQLTNMGETKFEAGKRIFKYEY
ncbi:MAG: CYTH domain-containing protein [Clostridia bacterium]|nr:CYTH domain-containing protein [Clostridia bacterium]